MIEYLTRDNVTFILALIGSIGTAYSVIMTFYWHRISIDFDIVEYCPSKDALVAYMSFTNNSRLPISITDVRIWCDCIPYSCTHTPEIVKIVTRTLGKDKTFQEAIHSLPLPINLPSLSGTSGFLYFQIPQGTFECDAKTLTVELSTNRHLKLRKTLSLEKSLRIVP